MAENTDGDLQKIIVLMQAQDRDFRVAMKKNADAMRRMTADGDREFRKLQKQMQAVDRQAWAAAGAMGGWGKSFVAGMAGGVVTAILGGITSDLAGVVKGVAAIGDEAKRAGLGVEEFQQWKYVAEQNRIGIDALVDGFKELSLRADEFVVTGAGSAAEAFERIGYTGEELKRKLKDPSALMLEIIERLQGLDKAAQIRITDELFGGAGGEQLLQLLGMSNDELRIMLERSREVGAVLESSVVQAAAEIDRKFSELTGKIQGWFKKIFVDLADMSEKGAPVWMKVIRAISDEIDALEAKAGEGPDLGEFGAAGLRALRMEVEGAVGELDKLSDALSGAGKLGQSAEVDALAVKVGLLVDLIAEADRMTPELSRKLADVGTEATLTLSRIGSIDGIDLTAAKSAISGLLGLLGAAADAAWRLRSNMPGPSFETNGRGQGVPPSDLAPRTSPRPQRPGVDSYGDWLDARNNAGGGRKGGGGGRSQSEYQRATESIREQTAALEAEAVALLATAESGKEYGDAVQYARRYAELLTAAQEDGRDVTPELRAEIDQLAASYVAAGEGAEAARDKMEAVRESARRGEDALVGIFESVLDGSRSAKDALGDLLMEMAKVQLRQAAMGVFGGSGIGGFLGGMLTPIAGARASGGSVVGGRPYLVNENTPNSEVFVPSRGGAILTSAQAQEAMRVRAVAPAAGRLGAEIRVKVYVEDDGKLAAVASQAGAQAALPVAVEVVKQNNRQQAQAQRRK